MLFDKITITKNVRLNMLFFIYVLFFNCVDSVNILYIHAF